MRIKKTFQTTVPTGKVLNNYTESNVDTYGCNYINGLETYSTDETRIGTWIDGRPIYRKVVARNLSITNGTTIDLSSLNINELIKIKSINTDSNRYTFFDEYYDNSTSKINLHYRDGIIESWTGSGVYYTSTVWIEYTKTTD